LIKAVKDKFYFDRRPRQTTIFIKFGCKYVTDGKNISMIFFMI